MTDTDVSASENMSGRLTAAQFAASPGVTDWRVLWGAGYAAAHCRTGSFTAALALVAAIGELAAAGGHNPDLVRPEGVTIRLSTAEVQGLSSRDINMAREISATRPGCRRQPTRRPCNTCRSRSTPWT